MRGLISRLLRRGRSRGQGLSENIITVALVAVGAIAIVSLFGDNIRALFGSSADSLGGDTSITEIAGDSSKVELRKDLSNFGASGPSGGGNDTGGARNGAMNDSIGP